MRSSSSQTGFSALEALLVVFIIGVLSTAGWFVYQHNRVKSTDAATNGNHTTDNTQDNQQPPATTPPAPTVTYLDIKEWGLKLPLSDAIKDAYYVPGISSKGTDGLPNQMWVGFTSLNTDGCTATNNSGPALIFRAPPTETDPVSGQLLTQKYPNGVTIGSYYYGYEDFTTSSSNPCKASQATLQTVNTALAIAAQGIVSATAN